MGAVTLPDTGREAIGRMVEGHVQQSSASCRLFPSVSCYETATSLYLAGMQ
jgi:hypothetical protein